MISPFSFKNTSKPLASMARHFTCCAIAAFCFLSPGFAEDVPAGYGVFASENLVIFDRADMRGGIVGANQNIELGAEAASHGSIIAGGDVRLRSQSDVYGFVKAGGQVLVDSDVNVAGGIEQNASVEMYTIPARSVTPGAENKYVNHDNTLTLAPGDYGDIVVRDRAQLVLSAGVYNVNKFEIGHDAELVLDYASDETVEINAQGDITLRDRAFMTYLDSDNATNISFYTNTTNEIYIGHVTNVSGAFTAPMGTIKVLARTTFEGVVHGKNVYLQPSMDAGDFQEEWMALDSDGDGVPDYVEDAIGSDKNDASDAPAVPVSGTYANKTDEGAQSLVVSVDDAQGYSRREVRMNFPQGSVEGNLLPVMQIKDADDPDKPYADMPDMGESFKADGLNSEKVYSIKGNIAEGEKLYYAFPLSDAAQHITFTRPENNFSPTLIKLFHYNESFNSWEEIEVDQVVDGVAYAWVESFSFYAAATFENVVKISPDFNDVANEFSSFENAFAAIKVNPEYGNESFVILAKGNEKYVEHGLQVPVYTSILGGFSDLPPEINVTVTSLSTGATEIDLGAGNAANFGVGGIIEVSEGDTREQKTIASISGDIITLDEALENPYTSANIHLENHIEPIVNDPKKYPVAIGPEVKETDEGQYIFDIPNLMAEADVDIFIDGLTFENYYTTTDSYGAALKLYGGGHVAKTYFRNCIFRHNTGRNAAAVYLFNSSDCVFQGCVFENNKTTNENSGTIFSSNSRGCGVGVQFESCLFYKNSSTEAGSATIIDHGYWRNDSPDDKILEVNIYNGTFVSNSFPSGAAVVRKVGGDGINDKVGIENTIVYSNESASDQDIQGPQNANNNFIDDRDDETPSPLFLTTNYSDDAAVKGADGIWGTADDGLQLQMSSECRNSAITNTAADKDVTGRTRIPVSITADYLPDMGAYERYLDILTIGAQNTLGNGSASYQMYLKAMAEENGYLVDYVGMFDLENIPSTVTYQDMIGRDPVNSEGNRYDVQTAAGFDETGNVNAGNIAYYSQASVLSDLKGITCDFSLVMLGEKELYNEENRDQEESAVPVFDALNTFLTNYSVGSKSANIIVSDLVNHKNSSCDINQFYNDYFYNHSVDFPANINVIYGSVNDYVSDESLVNQSDNIIDTGEGYASVAQMWWEIINGILNN